MRLLLDTHSYAWWVADDRRLGTQARAALIAPATQILLSAVVPWELAIKYHLGKWPEAKDLLADLDAAVVEDRLTPLPISLDHARRAGLLTWRHRDPFDRMLAAQAQAERAALVTGDPAFADIDVAIVW